MPRFPLLRTRRADDAARTMPTATNAGAWLRAAAVLVALGLALSLGALSLYAQADPSAEAQRLLDAGRSKELL